MSATLADFRIIAAAEHHLRAAALLAERLVRLHNEFDATRFAILADDIAGGYERWFRRCIADAQSVVIVAVDSADRVLGYSYGSLEDRNWNDLLDACGMIHDVYVDESSRRGGVGRALTREMVSRLTKLGAPRVLLKTAARNEPAQRMFASLGFRATMIEMTIETKT